MGAGLYKLYTMVYYESISKTRSHKETAMTSSVKFPEITVELTGHDGNAFAILGTVTRALRRAGHGDQASAFMAEATSGDYDHLLQTVMAWVDVE